MQNNVYNPHIRTKTTTASIMGDVCLALTPAAIGSVVFFGMRALLVILTSVVTCVAAEALWQLAHKEKVTVRDLSAVVTGILLAFNLSSTTPLWVVILGALFAILVAKQFFGGIGNNVFNPALMGRLFIMVVYPAKIMSYAEPLSVDGVAGATILSAVKTGAESSYSLMDAFIGKVPGALGETSALLLLLGFAFLVYKKEVNWSVSAAFFATVVVMMVIFGQDPLMQLCAGGLVLGGCFMLTDYNLSSGHGKWYYGVAAGVLVTLIRLFGSFPEGVCFAILLVNCIAPMLDQLEKRHVYGIE